MSASRRDEESGTLPGEFRRLGGWLEQPDDLQPELEGEVSADVIVVGAGFAGLSTALELTALGAKVVVLEQEFAGFGASGRNAGYLAGSLGVEFEFFLKRVGIEQAKKIVSFYDEGVFYVERRLAELGIDCDYNASGIIRAAVHSSQERRLRKSMRLGLELGSQAQFLDQAAMRARGIPPAFLFGCLQSHGGTLDPGKYVLGLRRAAIQAGVKLYENSALLSYSDGPTVTCRTARGSASATYLVLATNAYTPQLGLLRDKVVPLRVSAIETEPLSAAQLASLDWRGREGLVTPHWTMESHRLTARNSLLLTTKRLSYVYGSRTPNVADAAAYRALAEGLEARFPTLRGLGIRSCWSGYVSLAYDALPVVGETGAQRNILYTAGCSGHGVGTQSLVGHLLAERIAGIEHPLLTALRHKTPSTLPEPLQWCALNLGLGMANRLDDWTNRKAHAAART
ncbi:NAD(P)/FAD-dependent oxidoreductase [Pseudomonas aeruginosa]|uniref:NAD(P)/FAD-dependent oxidoreductase n=1 Tax=Pseudomonas aeruginosa TaxID=287 RepID=UPI001F1C9CA5|nr:FAD-dependent oxidoreductase [Pseudomonas aeruginosa]MDG4275161.1 FAD-binding oxidoreductase [Pseudomonas aeruginosa]HBO3911637.1 FAD-binding oxidoreductase [Pseudomonas aeruginosa]HCF5874560.1 FAD-binding oxidoreductase [Pseudomonas aeruginosa]